MIHCSCLFRKTYARIIPEAFCRRLVRAILTKTLVTRNRALSCPEALRHQGPTDRYPSAWCRRVSGGFAVQIDLRSHPNGSAGREAGTPPARPPLLYSPFRSISYIYLRISLFYERPALFASLNYRKNVLPVITPVDRPISRCRMHMRWICVVYRWCRQRSDRLVVIPRASVKRSFWCNVMLWVLRGAMRVEPYNASERIINNDAKNSSLFLLSNGDARIFRIISSEKGRLTYHFVPFYRKSLKIV